MGLLAQLLIGGLGLAGPILLVAVALSSSISSLRLINVAVGGIYVITAMLALRISHDSPGPGTLLVLFFMPIGLMLAFELCLFGPQRRNSRSLLQREQGSFALTAALATILTAIASQLAAGRDIALLSGALDFSMSATVGSFHIDITSLAIFCVALLAAGAWSVTLARTSLGAKFRCVAQDLELAESIGVRINQVALLNAAVSGVLVGIATCMILITTRAVGPESSGAVLLLPFAAVLLGGLDNIAGSVKAAILFGLISSLVGGYASAPQMADVAVFLVLFFFLIVKPEGMTASTTGANKTGGAAHA